MDADRFTRERQAGWDELAALVRQAGTKPQRLGPEALLRLGRRYRAAAADLALARRLFPGDPVTRRLERLVTDARQSVYATEPRRRSLRAFLATGYWRRVRERPWLLGLALALLFVPMALAAVWAIDDPAAAIGIVPAEFQGAAEPGSGTGEPRDRTRRPRLSSEIFTNNIRVTFLAIAGGILLGLGTAAVTIFNGGFIGAIFGLTIENGGVRRAAALRAPARRARALLHRGRGMAGLRLGWALVDPGPLTRGASLRREARPAMEIVLGTMPWLVLAGPGRGLRDPRRCRWPPPWRSACSAPARTGRWCSGAVTRARAPWPAGRRRRTRPAELSAGASTTCAPARRSMCATRARAPRTSSATACAPTRVAVVGRRGEDARRGRGRARWRPSRRGGG